MANVIDMDLTTPVSTRNGAGAADFVVCSKDAANNNKLDPTKGLITPVVPKYPYGVQIFRMHQLILMPKELKSVNP